MKTPTDEELFTFHLRNESIKHPNLYQLQPIYHMLDMKYADNNPERKYNNLFQKILNFNQLSLDWLTMKYNTLTSGDYRIYANVCRYNSSNISKNTITWVLSTLHNHLHIDRITDEVERDMILEKMF